MGLIHDGNVSTTDILTGWTTTTSVGKESASTHSTKLIPQSTSDTSPLPRDDTNQQLLPLARSESESDNTPFLSRITSDTEEPYLSRITSDTEEPYLSRITSDEAAEETGTWPPGTGRPLTTLSIGDGSTSDVGGVVASSDITIDESPSGTVSADPSRTAIPSATSSPRPGDKLSEGEAAAIVIGVVVILLAFIWYGRRFYNKKKRQRSDLDQHPRNSAPHLVIDSGSMEYLPTNPGTTRPVLQSSVPTWARPRGQAIELQPVSRPADGS